MSITDFSSKGAIRNECRALRKAMTAQEKAKADESVFKSFISLSEYIECKTLLIYISTPIEVNTRAVINHALACGKKVAAPVCGENGKMDFYYIDGLNSLVAAKFGIEEPIASQDMLVRDFDAALCAVPGMCFDELGFRVGFGGGYYDRFLAQSPVVSAGLCYESCVVSALPRESFDISVDLLVTDKTIRTINGRGHTYE